MSLELGAMIFCVLMLSHAVFIGVNFFLIRSSMLELLGYIIFVPLLVLTVCLTIMEYNQKNELEKLTANFNNEEKVLIAQFRENNSCSIEGTDFMCQNVDFKTLSFEQVQQLNQKEGYVFVPLSAIIGKAS